MRFSQSGKALFFQAIIFCSGLLLLNANIYADIFPTKQWLALHQQVPYILAIKNPNIPKDFRLEIDLTSSDNSKNNVIITDPFSHRQIDLAPGQQKHYISSTVCQLQSGCDDTVTIVVKSCNHNCFAIGTLSYNFLDKLRRTD